MCGIAGPDRRGDGGDVRPLIEALAHRGPDGVCVEDAPGDGAVLAHARLLDHRPGRRLAAAARGRLDGHRQRRDLQLRRADRRIRPEGQAGHRLRLRAAAAPLRPGRPGGLRSALRGMYAFCLIGGDGRTWLVRDPSASSRSIWAERDGAVAFASEPRALARRGVARAAVAEQAAGARTTSVEAETPFEGVRRLRAGAASRGGRGAGRVASARAMPAAASLGQPRRLAPRQERGCSVRLDAVLEDSVARAPAVGRALRPVPVRRDRQRGRSPP